MDIPPLSSLQAASKTQQNASNQQSSSQSSASQLSQLLALEAKSGALIQALVAEVTLLGAKEQQALLLELKSQIQELKSQIQELKVQTQQLSASQGKDTTSKDAATTSKPDANITTTSPTQTFSTSDLSSKLLEKTILGLEARIQLIEKVIRAQVPLQLINLKLNNFKAGTETLHTLSEKLFSPGESVNLRVRADGQLTLVSNTQSLDPQALSSKQTTDEAKRNMLLLAESLRQHLPLSSNNKRSIESLDKLLQSLIKIDRPLRASLVPPETPKLLGKLLANVFTPANRSEINLSSSPGNVKLAINKSGSFLEANIKNLSNVFVTTSPKISQPSTSQASTSQPSHSQTSVLLQKPLGAPTNRSLMSTIAATTSTTTSPPKPGSPTPAGAASEPAILEEDNKAILLKLLDQLNNASQQSNQLNTRQQLALRDPLLAILKSLGINVQKETPVKQLHTEAINELKQLVSITLSRIQSLQLRALAQGAGDIASNLLPGIELSLRVNEQIYPFLLYFQERVLKEKNLDDEEDKKKRKRKLSRQWKVFMQFEMDDCGWFASEVSLLDEKVTTRFWAQKNSTQKKLGSRLEDLKQKMENSGLLVEDIVLLPGEPPRPNTQVQQHLVDVQT